MFHSRFNRACRMVCMIMDAASLIPTNESNLLLFGGPLVLEHHSPLQYTLCSVGI